MDRDQPHPLTKERLSDADQAALAVSRGGPETTPERANLPKEVCWVPTTGADILFREQAQHRITGGNPLDRLGNQGCHGQDRKSTRLNSSHLVISYAVFCLKKKKETVLPQNCRTHRLGRSCREILPLVDSLPAVDPLIL